MTTTEEKFILGTSIFTGTFYADSYGPPPGFCFDTMCKDEPIMDYKDMDGYNVDEKVDLFISYVKKQVCQMSFCSP